MNNVSHLLNLSVFEERTDCISMGFPSSSETKVTSRVCIGARTGHGLGLNTTRGKPFRRRLLISSSSLPVSSGSAPCNVSIFQDIFWREEFRTSLDILRASPYTSKASSYASFILQPPMMSWNWLKRTSSQAFSRDFPSYGRSMRRLAAKAKLSADVRRFSAFLLSDLT